MKTFQRISLNLLIIFFGATNILLAQRAENTYRYFSVTFSPLSSVQVKDDELREKEGIKNYTNTMSVNATFYPLYNIGIGYFYDQNKLASSDNGFSGEYVISNKIVTLTYRTDLERCGIIQSESTVCQFLIFYGQGQSLYKYNPDNSTLVNDFTAVGGAKIYFIGINGISTWAFNLGTRLGLYKVDTSYDKIKSKSGDEIEIDGNFLGFEIAITWGL